MSRSEQNGKSQNSLKNYGFTSFNDVYFYVPIDGNGNDLVDETYYRQQSRILQTVDTSLGAVYLTAEHDMQPAANLWKFDGAIQSGDGTNTGVRLLLAKIEGRFFAYVQMIHPHEGIDPDTGDIRLISGE